MTYDTWNRAASARLADSGCPDPEVDARLLLEHATGFSPVEQRRHRNDILTDAQLERLEACLKRRLAGEPVQYITGLAWFFGFPVHVDPRVLIPRADTENLVEAAGRFLSMSLISPTPRVLDLCTGSGAIGLALARLVPRALVTLTDISADALDVARQNAAALGVEARVELLAGDLFSPVPGQMFEAIVCNPPYIPSGELSSLQREVQREPALALDGGVDGLDFYRRLAAEVGEHLVPGGCVYLEVGSGQAQAVLNMLREALNAHHGSVINDLHGVERVVWAKKPQ